MAQLVALVVSEDSGFKKQVTQILRSGSIPVSVIAENQSRDNTAPDFILVDIRGDALAGMAAIERVRGAGLRRTSVSRRRA